MGMVRLEDWCYKHLDRRAEDMLAGRKDHSLRLFGRTYGHPTSRDGKGAYLSAPVAYDEKARVVKTISGSEYALGKCAENEIQQIKLLLRDVKQNALMLLPSEPTAAPAPSPSLAAGPEPAPRPRGVERTVTGTSDDAVISLDMDSDEDPTFGRVFGHDEDDRSIDAILEEAIARNNIAEQIEAPPRGEPVYDAIEVERLDS